MVTDHTRAFVDVPQPNRAILRRRQQKASLTVETRAIHRTAMTKQWWYGRVWQVLVSGGRFRLIV